MKHGGTLSTIRRSPLVEGHGRLFPIMQDIVLYHATLVSTLSRFGYETSFLSCLDSYFSRWRRTQYTTNYWEYCTSPMHFEGLFCWSLVGDPTSPSNLRQGQNSASLVYRVGNQGRSAGVTLDGVVRVNAESNDPTPEMNSP
jgi:hypothetical protein